MGGKLRDSPGFWGCKHLSCQVISQNLHKALQTTTSGWAERRDSMKSSLRTDFFFFWSTISLWCINFYWTEKWTSHMYTCIPARSGLPPSHPSPLGHHRTLGWAPCAVRRPPTGHLLHTRWAPICFTGGGCTDSVLTQQRSWPPSTAASQHLDEGWGSWIGHNRSPGLFIFFHFVQTG